MENFLIEEFTSYKVVLYSGNSHGHSILIDLPSGKAIFRFTNGKVKVPQVINEAPNYEFTLYQDVSYYPMFIDLLRNEKPLFFYFNFDNDTSYITTTNEPVGEGE